MSDHEPDSGNATQPKRRRVDKEPVRPRRHSISLRKSPTVPPLPAGSQQSSDNDVQDTILVGLSADGHEGNTESGSNHRHVPLPRPTIYHPNLWAIRSGPQVQLKKTPSQPARVKGPWRLCSKTRS